MMASNSILAQTALHSALASESVLKPSHGRWKRVLSADLLLTALIDAFSILVIFLLMNFSSTGEILFVGKGMELPKAVLGDVLERNTVIKLEEGKIFLEGQEVTIEGLMAALIEAKKTAQEAKPGEEIPSIATIQADRRLKYENLNQVVLALSHSGYSDIRFAVLMK